MFTFYIDKTEELTTGIIGRMIRKFNQTNKPYLKKCQDYYDGRQDIMRRAVGDPARPNNKIVRNYCSSIVDNFQGYLCGTPITYTGKDGADIDQLLDIFDQNDIQNSDSEFLRNALIYGIAYQLCYINERMEKKFKNVSPLNIFPIYSSDLDEDLLAAVYFTPIITWDETQADTNWNVSIYTDRFIYHYIAANNFNSFTALGAEEHYFNEVPVSIFNLNNEGFSIFEKIVTLQDAYNKLISDEVNDFESFVDAYMVLKNVSATEEELAAMKETRTILLDGEDDVSYLTKDFNTDQISQLLDDINVSIRTVANSPDFSSEEFGTGVSSGIALQFKLVGFNNTASNIEAQMRKALQKRIELLNNVLSLVDTAAFDVDITFNYNLPTSIADVITNVNALRGLVSDETLLTQIPFIDDVDMELERIKEQNDSYTQVYDFNMHEEEEPVEGE